MVLVCNVKCPRCGAAIRPRHDQARAICDRCGHAMALRFDASEGAYVSAHSEAPPDSRVVIEQTGRDEITVIIPGGRRAWPFLLSGIVLAAVSVVTLGISPDVMPLWVNVLSALSGLAALAKGLFNLLGVCRVRVNPNTFSVRKVLAGIGWRRSGRTEQIVALDVVDRNEGKTDGEGHELRAQEMIEIRTAWSRYGFGLSLSPADRLWVVRELRVFLRDIGHPVD